MSSKGKFKKQLSLSDLTFIGFGAIFGSGWLFSASHVSALAGPGGILSWIIGGIAILLLGLVYCELGAAIPRAGGIVRYPVYSHGPLIGYLIGSITVIAYSSLIAIEVEAGRQYAAAWFPSLTKVGSSSPTITGWLFQFALLCIFFLLNYWSVKTFAKSNMIITIFKFLVPTLTIFVLLTHFKSANFSVAGFAPSGFQGIQGAISIGGVIFAYLGLTPIVAVASEAKNPQRTIPIALILSVVLSTIVYVLLQVAFLGSIPTDMLKNGWSGIDKAFSLPFKDIATVLGLWWLGVFIVSDAIISPSGTANIYMSTTPRTIYGWARGGTLFKIFTKVDEKSGIPRPAVWLSFVLSIFWTLPFPSWDTLISVVSAALVFSYAIAPICAGAFRNNAPDLKRPFYLKGMSILGPLSFIIASLIVYWSGWSTISWLFGSQILMFVVYLFFKKWVPTNLVSFAQQIKSSLWLIFYYACMMVVSGLGVFGGNGTLQQPWDLIITVIISLVAYYWGTTACLPKAIIDDDDIESDTFDTPSQKSVGL
ncbi:APC family permease [Bacillus salipaludis]|uniref:APC family permease n=1 Tax=Bacillus salipaludis TaxID=2547811 RepID=A0AA90TWK6_9BACI|nr:APC family permease [Bacillus salipaludis]MDQ6600831.1 APC family permease [Bacillus salipaludis]